MRGIFFILPALNLCSTHNALQYLAKILGRNQLSFNGLCNAGCYFFSSFRDEALKLIAQEIYRAVRSEEHLYRHIIRKPPYDCPCNWRGKYLIIHILILDLRFWFLVFKSQML